MQSKKASRGCGSNQRNGKCSQAKETDAVTKIKETGNAVKEGKDKSFGAASIVKYLKITGDGRQKNSGEDMEGWAAVEFRHIL